MDATTTGVKELTVSPGAHRPVVPWSSSSRRTWKVVLAASAARSNSVAVAVLALSLLARSLWRLGDRLSA